MVICRSNHRIKLVVFTINPYGVDPVIFRIEFLDVLVKMKTTPVFQLLSASLLQADKNLPSDIWFPKHSLHNSSGYREREYSEGPPQENYRKLHQGS